MTELELPLIHRWNDPPCSAAPWQLELDAHFPRGGDVSWLEIRWLPGERWDPVQRWGIYEASPGTTLPAWKREYLADFERSDLEQQFERGRVVREYFATGVLLEPFWIIQGEKGGTPYRISEADRKMLELAGLSGEPPLPGDLPYAPFDNTVLQAVLAWDRLRKGYDTLEQAHHLERRRKEQEFRKQIWEWSNNLVGNELAPHARNISNDGSLPVLDYDPIPDLDPVRERYIATGNI